jgi:hypothetical protein
MMQVGAWPFRHPVTSCQESVPDLRRTRGFKVLSASDPKCDNAW